MVPFSFKVICRNNSFSYSSILFFNNLLTYNIFNYSFVTNISGWIIAFPCIFIFSLMLGALGLLLSVYIKQLENFAGTMNFVIFPMFFISSALYPLWRLLDNGALFVYYLAKINPFTYGVEMVRACLTR